MAQSERERLFLEAIEVTRLRGAQYGSPTADFTRCAAIWNVIFGPLLALGQQFEPYHVAQGLIALKQSRMVHSPEKTDHWLDLVGYGGCGFECCVESGLIQEPDMMVMRDEDGPEDLGGEPFYMMCENQFAHGTHRWGLHDRTCMGRSVDVAQ